MTVLPSPNEQVAYESRLRMRYAIVAFVAGVLVVASLLIQEIGFHSSLTEETVQLLQINRRSPLDIIGASLDALGLFATGYLLWWLNSISLARDPKLSPITRWLVLVGAPLMGVLEVVSIVIYTIKAHSFVHGGNLGYPEAYRLIHPISKVLAVVSLVEELGALLLAAGFIWSALNAMKVGLLPRPMGYAGVIAGALVIFAIGPISFVIQGAWLVCMAVLVSGRWPNEPPAWAQGVAIPWMTANARQGANARQRPANARGNRGRGGPVAGTSTANSGAEAEETASTGTATGAASAAGDYTPRRKKKRR